MLKGPEKKEKREGREANEYEDFFLIIFSSSDNTAGIITRKDGYSRTKMNTYLLPVLIFDNDYPIQSSTGTLTIRVCACDNQGNMQSCNAEALMLAAGLSTGALIAILLCVIILLSKLCISQSSPPEGLLHCQALCMMLFIFIILLQLFSMTKVYPTYFFFVGERIHCIKL